MPGDWERWVERLPSRAGSTLRRLARQTLEPDVPRLLAAIDAHEAAAERHLSQNEFLDIEKCRSLARLARALVHSLASLPEPRRRVATMAVCYFAVVHDSEDDFGSPIGFDDDEVVLRSAAELCGLEELLEQA